MLFQGLRLRAERRVVIADPGNAFFNESFAKGAYYILIPLCQFLAKSFVIHLTW